VIAISETVQVSLNAVVILPAMMPEPDMVGADEISDRMLRLVARNDQRLTVPLGRLG
jgi:hypothetical protein